MDEGGGEGQFGAKRIEAQKRELARACFESWSASCNCCLYVLGQRRAHLRRLPELDRMFSRSEYM